MELVQVIGKILNASGEQETLSLAEVMRGLEYQSGYWRWENRKVTPEAMGQFVQARLGGIPGILNDESLRPAFKMDYLQQKVAALPPHDITVRFNDKVTGFVPAAQAEYTNTNIAKAVGSLMPRMPSDVQVHRFHITPDGSDLFLRLVSPSQWNFGEYFGGLAISNRELKDGMKVRPGVAKVSCFNWCLRQNIFQPEDAAGVQDTILSGLNMITTFSNEAVAGMVRMGNINVQKIQSLFDLVASEMRLPDNVKSEMYKYWVQQGSGRSVFDVVQAVTWGTQALTDNTGRKRPRWADRDNLEEAIWGWSGEVMEQYSQGVNLDEMVANRELVKKSRVMEALRTQDNPNSYIQALPPDGFSKM